MLPRAGGRHSGTVPITLGTYGAYKTCQLFVCTRAYIWSRRIGNQILFSVDVTDFYVSVKYIICIHIGLYTIMF